jgi:predicted TIM-barrel fold metal-dependent hydrolase
MDSLNITHTVLSITGPGTHLVPNDDALAKKVTREANDYMASLCTQYPKRFSFFASLPLPSISDSLAEMDYAKTLSGFKGFALLTNTHGIYLGDAHYDSVFEKFNELKSLVFIHPANCHHVSPSTSEVHIVNPLAGLPASMLEYVFDSTRCVTSLLLSATPQRFRDITFILPHCGTTLAVTLSRVAGFSGRMMKTKLPGAVGLEEMKKVLNEQFYFDLAGFTMPDQLEGVLAAGLGGGSGAEAASRIVYGTDFPYLNKDVQAFLAEELDEGLDIMFKGREDIIQGIYVDTSKKLLGL